MTRLPYLGVGVGGEEDTTIDQASVGHVEHSLYTLVGPSEAEVRSGNGRAIGMPNTTCSLAA